MREWSLGTASVKSRGYIPRSSEVPPPNHQGILLAADSFNLLCQVCHSFRPIHFANFLCVVVALAFDPSSITTTSKPPIPIAAQYRVWLPSRLRRGLPVYKAQEILE